MKSKDNITMAKQLKREYVEGNYIYGEYTEGPDYIIGYLDEDNVWHYYDVPIPIPGKGTANPFGNTESAPRKFRSDWNQRQYDAYQKRNNEAKSRNGRSPDFATLLQQQNQKILRGVIDINRLRQQQEENLQRASIIKDSVYEQDNKKSDDGGNPTQAGVDYFYDGTSITEGKKNNLETNRLIKIRNEKETTTIFDLKKTRLKFVKQPIKDWPDGAYIFLNEIGEGDFAFSLYRWLYMNANKQVDGKIAEWSIVQYKTIYEPNRTYSRIATSFDSDREYTNLTISKNSELKKNFIEKIKEWRHFHSHLGGSPLPSDPDENAYDDVKSLFKLYKSIVIPKFYISPFDDYRFLK